MKLLSCHIENFGKLRDFTYYFEEGLGVLFAENGWGKSTFAAFLKVMFYGFDGENKRKPEGSERLRYRPWGGGVYGGSVTFEDGASTYRMLRTFGAGKKEDTFRIYNNATGMPSADYSERIGEELFGIDRDSFCRTVFWSQTDHETFATTSIQAKIGDLTFQEDDLPAYDTAVKRLRKEMDRLRPDRAIGLIRKKEDRLRILEAEEARLPVLEAELTQCIEKEEALSAELEEIRALKQQYALEVPRDSGMLMIREELDRSERKLAACKESRRDVVRCGREERAEYSRVKKELRREIKNLNRIQKERCHMLQAASVLCFLFAVLLLTLCLFGILPAPLYILPAVCAVLGFAVFLYGNRLKDRIPVTEEVLRLRWSEKKHRDSLRALLEKLRRTDAMIRAQQMRCEELKEKIAPVVYRENARAAHLQTGVTETLSEYDRQEEDCRARLQEIRRRAEELREMHRDCRESCELLPALREEIGVLREQYDTCAKTLSYLEEARDQFTSRYMDRFLRSFARYYSMLTGESAESVRTDADFSIRILDGGIPRDPSLMSEGTRDSIGLCRRMAMIDAMYPGEKPFLVLDDPFSNLDDERVEGGLRFLQSVSLDYQILYLTCHESRLSQ